MDEKTQKLKSAEDQLLGKAKEINKLNDKISQFTQELKGTEAQLAEKKKETSGLNDQIAQLEEIVS
ncbi:MAG: hypothetical protein ACEY3A_01970 [Wolbachia sp.]